MTRALRPPRVSRRLRHVFRTSIRPPWYSLIEIGGGGAYSRSESSVRLRDWVVDDLPRGLAKGSYSLGGPQPTSISAAFTLPVDCTSWRASRSPESQT